MICLDSKRSFTWSLKGDKGAGGEKGRCFCGQIGVYVHRLCETGRKVYWKYLNHPGSASVYLQTSNPWNSFTEWVLVCAGAHHYNIPGVFSAIPGRNNLLGSELFFILFTKPGLVWSLVPQFLAVLSVYPWNSQGNTSQNSGTVFFLGKCGSCPPRCFM